MSNYSQHFYSGSYYFDGSSDYLVVTDSTDLEFGTGDYTIEFWVRPASVAYYWMFSKRSDYADVAPYTMMSTPSGTFEYSSSSNDSSAKLYTSYAIFYLPKNLVETDRDVTIITEDSTTTGNGLSADFDKGLITILSDVERVIKKDNELERLKIFPIIKEEKIVVTIITKII